MDDFDKLALDATRGGFFRDYWHLVRQSRKWWMIPLLLIMLTMAGLILLGGTGAAPFIYTLF